MNIEPFTLPLARPFETARGSIDHREGFLVSVEHNGEPGLGEATPLPPWTESHAACAAALDAIDDPTAAMTNGTLTDRPAARHGVSLAVLDAEARAADQPLYRYLGGPSSVADIPVNATIDQGSPAATADAAETAVAAGYQTVKVKVGSRDVAGDLSRLEALRERCPSVTLRVDANGAWDAATADRALQAFTEVDVSLIEQPLPAEALEGHATLRATADATADAMNANQEASPVEIALDEGLMTHGIESIIAAEAADIVVCKPMALGGIDTARNVAVAARAAGLDVVVTTTIDGAVARAATVHLAASLPVYRACGLATGDYLARDLRTDIAPVADGVVAVPHGKGNIPPR